MNARYAREHNSLYILSFSFMKPGGKIKLEYLLCIFLEQSLELVKFPSNDFGKVGTINSTEKFKNSDATPFCFHFFLVLNNIYVTLHFHTNPSTVDSFNASMRQHYEIHLP